MTLTMVDTHQILAIGHTVNDGVPALLREFCQQSDMVVTAAN